MSTQDTISTLKEIYRLWSNGDQEAVSMLLDNLSDDVNWCSIADGCKGAEFTRERNGVAGVQSYFEELSNDWEMIHFTVDEFVCEGERVVMLGSCGWRHRASGNSIETPKIDVWKIKDNKIAEFREFYDTAKMMQIVAAT